MANTPPPMSAAVVYLGEDKTTAAITIFGRDIECYFFGSEHHKNACEWVAVWNAHLNKEWQGVRESAAAMMQGFTQALHSLGVDEATTDAALKSVMQHAKS